MCSNYVYNEAEGVGDITVHAGNMQDYESASKEKWEILLKNWSRNLFFDLIWRKMLDLEQQCNC